MNLSYKSPSALGLGFYLLYVKSKSGKYMYIFEITEESMTVYKMLVCENPQDHVTVFTTARHINRGSLSRGRDATIFELTEEEFMLEISDLI